MKDIFKQFLLVAFVSQIAAVAGYLIAPVEVRYLQTLAANSILIGLTFALGALILGILGIYFGRLSDRYGRSQFIKLGLFVGILYPLMYAHVQSIFLYMGVKLFWAYSIATTGILYAYLQDLIETSPRKAEFIGYLWSVGAIAGAIGAVLGGKLTELYGFRVTYYAMAMIYAIAFICGIFFIKAQPPQKNHTQEKSWYFSISHVMNTPALRYYFVANGAFGLGWGIKIFLWPLIIFSITQSDAATGYIFAGMGVAAFIVLLFIGKVVDRIGYHKPMIFSLMALAIGTGLVAISDSQLLLWVGAIIVAIGEAAQGTTQGALLTTTLSSSTRGEILGFDQLVDKILQSVSPLIAGTLLVIISAQIVLGLYVFVYILALITLLFMRNYVTDLA